MRLAAHDYHPHVATGDGADGVPKRAPFDRVIATCGLDQVPQPWIDQTRNGGNILVNVLGPWNLFTLVLLTVHGDTASGRFLRQWGGFMPRRTDPTRAFDYTVRIARVATDPAESDSTVDPQTLSDDSAFGVASACSRRGPGASGTRSRRFTASGSFTTGPLMIGSGSPSAAGLLPSCGWTGPTTPCLRDGLRDTAPRRWCAVTAARAPRE